MAKLPNGNNAVVSIEKFTEYLLNPEHPTGRHKARVFKAALGLTLENAEFLRDIVQQIAMTGEADHQEPTSYGERYVIDFELATERGTARVRTAWIVHHGEDFPHLTTCYVLEE
jgi:hypothetical protein